MLKKIFVTSLGFFLVVLFLWGLYFLTFSKTESLPNQTQPDNKSDLDLGNEGSVAKTGSMESITDTPIISPVISPSGAIRYFEKNTGYAWEINPETKEKKLLVEKKTAAMLAAAWSSDTSTALIKTQSSAGSRFWYSHMLADQAIALKPGMRYAVWDSISEKILYTFTDSSSKTSINVSDPAGNNWRTLAAITSDRFVLSAIPRSSYVSFWEPAQNTRMSELFTLNIAGGEAKKIYSGKYGADYLWSPDGEHVLVSFAPEKSGSKILLGVMNKFGGQFNTLNTPTLVSKCAWKKDGIYVICALPTSIPQSAIMPDDYMNGNVQTTDTFWTINTQTGESKRSVELKSIASSFDASQLFLSPNEDVLYFVNKKDGLLYKTRL